MNGQTQMSAPKVRLVLTKRAQRDARNIQLYTLGEWGPEQAIKYDAAIDRVFGTLRDNPMIGKVREDLQPNLRSFPAEHHVIFYRIKKNVVEIVRILHERADAARHLRRR